MELKIVKYVVKFFTQEKAKFKKDLALVINKDNVFSFQNHEEVRVKILGLTEKYNLFYNTSRRIYKRYTRNMISDFISEEISGNKLSEEGSMRIKRLCELIGVADSKEVLTDLQPYREMAESIQPIHCDLLLQKNEYCYFIIANVNLSELRKRIERVGYYGPRARIKIAKGFSYLAGSSAISVKSTDQMTKIDRGTLYFTNKRIVFKGAKGNKLFKPAQILGYEVTKTSLLLSKDAGKNPFFTHGGDLRTSLFVERMFKEFYCATE
jgi:hypothetical protein